MRARASNLGGDYRRHSPFRKPEWRWAAAEDLARTGLDPRPWEDPAIAAVLDFCRLRNRANADWERRAVRRRWPDLAAAHDLFAAACDDVLRGEVEARLLAGEDSPIIAMKTGTEAATVDSYERYFFNVADAADATAWLLIQAVGIWPGVRRELNERDVWCYWAVGGGPLLVDLLVDDHLGRPCPRARERRHLAARARFLARDYATDWSCRPLAAAMIREGCELFAHCRDSGGTDESRLLAGQLDFLRRAYGLGPIRRRSRRRASPRGSDVINPVGRGIARDDKEHAHGRD